MVDLAILETGRVSERSGKNESLHLLVLVRVKSDGVVCRMWLPGSI